MGFFFSFFLGGGGGGEALFTPTRLKRQSRFNMNFKLSA